MSTACHFDIHNHVVCQKEQISEKDRSHVLYAYRYWWYYQGSIEIFEASDLWFYDETNIITDEGKVAEELKQYEKVQKN